MLTLMIYSDEILGEDAIGAGEGSRLEHARQLLREGRLEAAATKSP